MTEIQKALKDFKPPFRVIGCRLQDSDGDLCATVVMDSVPRVTKRENVVARFLAKSLNDAVKKRGGK